MSPMSESLRVPSDDLVRQRVRRELGTTFLVEAGAGTGKTSVLVDRYVACLLDREGTTIDRVVAITFTEKAAGELRQRIRQRLEELLSEPPGATTSFGELDGSQLARLRAALDALEMAPISTIHAFAARILRERPVEAGVDPAFTQLDALGSELVFKQLWDDWLAQVLSQADAGSGAQQTGDGSLLAEVLGAEVSLATLRGLAQRIFAARYEVQPPRLPTPPDLGRLTEELKRSLAEAARFSATCADEGDKLYAAVRSLSGVVEDALSGVAADADLHSLGQALWAARVSAPKRRANDGRQAAWGGKENKARMGELLDACVEQLAHATNQYGAYIAELALGVAWRFARYAAERQLTLGLLDFADLLGKARDVLRDFTVRRYFQRRFRYLLVDEFQDTDPVQAEMLFLLAEREPRARHWTDVQLEPGKLFLVGDPKQSIYRFRGADIATYQRVREHLTHDRGAELLAITANFRTVQPIIAWVNAVFETVFGGQTATGAGTEDSRALTRGRSAPPMRVDYVPLEAVRNSPDGEPRVLVIEIPHESDKPKAAELRRREAALIAELLADVAAGRWTVTERVGGRERQRPAGVGDVLVLFPTFTDIDIYERALRDADLPYRIEGGRTYFGRREVSDAILGLRAIDDAAAPLATYAALHSSLFGFSDDELLAFHQAGGRFDYLSAQADLAAERRAEFADLLAALDLLRDLHEGRTRRPLPETLDLLLRSTRFLELQAAWGDGAEQSVGNLAKLMSTVETFAGEPEATFHGLVTYLADAQTKAEVGESPVGEPGRFARLTTVHKAKGLEAPIVVLANAFSGGGRSNSGEGVQLLVDRQAGRVHCSLSCQVGAAGAVYESLGWANAKETEDQALAEERRRLAYVACTRAADHLIIPVASTGEAKAETLLAYVSDHLQGSSLVTRQQWQATGRRPGAARPPLDADALWRRRAQWLAARQASLRAATVPAAVTTPSALETTTPVGAAGSATRRQEALAIGSAVHRVMELIPLQDEDVTVPGGLLDQLAALAAAEAGCLGSEARIAELARVCWWSEPVRAAAQASRCWREMPIAVHDAGSLVQGKVDLLYESDDGRLVIVDYKTDSDADPQLIRQRYAVQGGAYALAVSAALAGTGGAAAASRVSEVVFVLAAAAPPVVRLPVDDALMAATRARIAAVVAH